jgi:hypothetical protein
MEFDMETIRLNVLAELCCQFASVSSLPGFRRHGGYSILLDFGDAIDLTAYLQPFLVAPSDVAFGDMSSDEAWRNFF